MAPNFIKAFMAPKSECLAFTNFTIQVNLNGSWADTVKLIQKNVHGVVNFHMENDGKIYVSGCIYPTLFLKCLKKAGKKRIRILHWQYGKCSSYLFEKPAKEESPKKSNEYKSDGYYLECGWNEEDGFGHDIEKPTNSKYDVEKPRDQVAILPMLRMF